MRKLFKVSLVSILFIILAFATASPNASASLIFDRGLPTNNLNNAAGSNRSNVAWAEGVGTPSDYWIVGDDFSISGSGTYHVDTISVWAIGLSAPLNSTSLWFGPENGTLSNIGTVDSISPATYTGGISYQGTSGSYIPFSRLDFVVNQNVTAGTTYQFFLDNAFLHSSNSTLSGSTQQGADDYLWALNIINGASTSPEQWQSLGGGWDKNSDANIQVYGSAVPIPAAVWLLGSGIVGLVAVRRRMKE